MISGSLSPQHGASTVCGWRNGHQTWRVAANILNKKSRTDGKGWFSSLGAGRGANNSSKKTGLVIKRINVPRTWTGPLVRHKKWQSGHGLDWSD